MTDTPNRPPLWEVMSDACADHPRGVVDLHSAAVAAEIRALRDWLVPEEPQEHPYINSDFGWIINTDNATRWADRQRLRALLTAEADRAERGDA